jgi:hypothetical protein
MEGLAEVKAGRGTQPCLHEQRRSERLGTTDSTLRMALFARCRLNPNG